VLRNTADGVVIDIRVTPRASSTGIVGIRDGALLVRLHAAPVDGAANDALIELIAKTVGVPRRAVAVVSGERARRKRVRISGVSLEQVRSALGHG
jgi:uncharacterized protein (TIGR00251 family)